MSTVRGAVLRAIGARPFAASRPLQVTTFTAQEPRAGEIAVDIVYWLFVPAVGVGRHAG